MTIFDTVIPTLMHFFTFKVYYIVPTVSAASNVKQMSANQKRDFKMMSSLPQCITHMLWQIFRNYQSSLGADILIYWIGFFRSNRPGYPHPVSSELENSGIRVAVGDCSITERRRWHPPYQTGKTVHVHAKHCEHNEDRRRNGSVLLSHSGNVVTKIGIHTHTTF